MESPQSQKFDIDRAAKRFNEEMLLPEEVFMEMLYSTVAITKTDLKELETAIHGRNWDEIQKVSHRLKGVFANLRLDDFGGIAGRMNQLAKQQERFDEVQQLFAAFQQQFMFLCNALPPQ